MDKDIRLFIRRFDGKHELLERPKCEFILKPHIGHKISIDGKYYKVTDIIHIFETDMFYRTCDILLKEI